MLFKVEKLVSLGAWDQTTRQLRRMFGSRLSSLYDWLVTPLGALIALLEDHGAELRRKVGTKDNEFPICDHYGPL